MRGSSSSSSSSGGGAASSTWRERWKRIDLYSELPSDLTEQTVVGALTSLVAFVLIAYLVASETWSYVRPDISHRMLIDRPRHDLFSAITRLQAPTPPSSSGANGSATAASSFFLLNNFLSGPLFLNDPYDSMTVHLNLTMLAMPCALVSIDVQDVTGGHVMGVSDTLLKARTDLNGVPKRAHDGSLLYHASGASSTDPSTLDAQRNEGCNIAGTLSVKKVPGNVHISAHEHPELVTHFFPSGHLNVSHIVHGLSFGKWPGTLAALESRAVIDPLANLTRVDRSPFGGTQPLHVDQRIGSMAAVAAMQHDAQHQPKSYEYYLKLVPTSFEHRSGRVYDAFQYTAHATAIAGRYRMSVVFFRYDIEAITTHFSYKGKSFAHFIVQICAIVGGVFTILGLVNSLMLGGIKRLRKHQMGKLG